MNSSASNLISTDDDDNMIRRVQVRVWKFEPPDTLLIELKSVKEDPQDIQLAISQFIETYSRVN